MSRLLPRLGRLAVVAAGLALMAVNSAVAADSYPSRPIKMISPFSAGSPPDAFGRLIAQQMSATLGHSVVVENRPGAGTTLGTKAGAMADPDGYTLVQANAALSYAPVLYPNSGYDPVKSFVPVAMLATWTHVLVAHPDVPANSMQELVAYAKANPGKLNHGAAGAGNLTHLAGELFKLKANVDFITVQYKSAAEFVTGLLGGQVDLAFDAVASLLPQIQAGKLRALAVTSAGRQADFPDVPTMREAGVTDYVVTAFFGVAAPSGTPAPIVARLNAVINESLQTEELKSVLKKIGGAPTIETPDQVGAFIAAELKKWKDISDASGIKVD
jgi:tripartite-type tricarboxylate transporter receptor subunit TctC